MPKKDWSADIHWMDRNHKTRAACKPKTDVKLRVTRGAHAVTCAKCKELIPEEE